MEELSNIKASVSPSEILLVVDAMTGQDAVNVSQSFNEQLGIDGVILTKMDGDARGGAALCAPRDGKADQICRYGRKTRRLRAVLPRPYGVAVLGMGDVLTLIDKAQEAFDEKQAAELEKKLTTSGMDLRTFWAAPAD